MVARVLVQNLGRFLYEPFYEDILLRYHRIIFRGVTVPFVTIPVVPYLEVAASVRHH